MLILILFYTAYYREIKFEKTIILILYYKGEIKSYIFFLSHQSIHCCIQWNSFPCVCVQYVIIISLIYYNAKPL